MKRKQHTFLRFVLSVIILAVVVELVSLLLINVINLPQKPFFNRTYSPICTFENTPGYTYHNCTGKNNSDNDVTIDPNGFITNNIVLPEKAENTYRIILVGGSAAFGNGQSVPYNTIKPYPQGIYTFDASVAGLLEKKLQAQFPERNIEVINACASGRTLSQSIALYKAKLRKFKPDMVVSLDGMNETVFFGITFEMFMQKKLECYYKDLQHKTVFYEKKTPFSTLALFKRLSVRKMQHRSNKILNEKAPALCNYNYNDYSAEDYQKIKPVCIKNAEIFISNVLNFNNLCNNDSVRFVFGLQPILYRQAFNKKLSDTENKMRTGVNPVNLSLTTNLPAPWLDTISLNANLFYKFFFDDYLSQVIANRGGERLTFVDFNKEIVELNSDVEFYTDYCHLTPDGNAFVASVLAKQIEMIIIKP